MLFEQILRPFGYLFIKHPYKWRVDWLIPSVTAGIVVVAVFGFGSVFQFFREGGPVSLILSFTQSLPGFFIAALAAIAAFGRNDIDDILPEPTPRMAVKFRGKVNLIQLTRRKFLSMLFAFLTAEAFLLIFMSISLLSFHDEFRGLESYFFGWADIILGGVILVYFIVVFQMVAATLWGLYYLGYKLHE